MTIALARRGVLAKQTVGGGGSGPATGTVFVEDSFADTAGTFLESHTVPTGGPANRHPLIGSASHHGVISDVNRLRNDDAANFNTEDAVYYYSGTPTTAEYDVTGYVYVVATSVAFTSLCARMRTTSPKHWYDLVFDDDTNTLSLRKHVEGVTTTLDTEAITPTANTLYIMRLQVRNADKKGFLRSSDVSKAVTAAAATDLFTATAHGYSAGDEVRFTAVAGGAGITPVSVAYYVIASGLTADDFKVSATLGGSAVDVTSDMTAGRVARFASAEAELLTTADNALTSADKVGVQLRNIQNNTQGVHLDHLIARNV